MHFKCNMLHSYLGLPSAHIWLAAKLLDKLFATMFRLHRIAPSSTTMFIDLLLVCLANATCAIINIMTTLIFIILIVSRLHAFFLVVPIRSSLHVLVAVAVISYFQHSDIVFPLVAAPARNPSLSNPGLESVCIPRRGAWGSKAKRTELYL